MASIDYLNPGERKKVLDEILNNQENLNRKENSLITLECFKGRQKPYILAKMRNELGEDAVQNSRTITSINLTKKIVKKKARLYSHEPDREFSELNERQDEHVRRIYELSNIDVKLKKAHEILKLQDQAMVQVVPKDGVIELRPLFGHHYDVIHKMDNPEKAECVIVSSFDKSRVFNREGVHEKGAFNLGNQNRSYFNDFKNQKIGEPDDYKSNMIFYWWTDGFNFATDGNGHLVDPESGQKIMSASENELLNPFGVLPFVDIATDKDFEFFVRSGYSSTAFNLDLGVLLSDTAEVNRMQSWAQGVMASVEQPKNIKVGPRNLMWLKLNPKDPEGARPSFQFVSPNPDLTASLSLISNYLSMYLTSEDMSPKEVNAMGEADVTTSGVDRWLKMIEQFDSNQDDIPLFTSVEKQIYKIIKAQNNVLANATDNGFIPELQGVMLPETSDVEVKFHKPEMLMSEQEKLSLIREKIEMGLISSVEAIEIDRNVERDQALEIKAQIAQDDMDASEVEDEIGPPQQVPPEFQMNQGEEIIDDDETDDEDVNGETEQSGQA